MDGTTIQCLVAAMVRWMFFSSIQFTAQGKVSRDEVVDDNQDLPAGF